MFFISTLRLLFCFILLGWLVLVKLVGLLHQNEEEFATSDPFVIEGTHVVAGADAAAAASNKTALRPSPSKKARNKRKQHGGSTSRSSKAEEEEEEEVDEKREKREPGAEGTAPTQSTDRSGGRSDIDNMLMREMLQTELVPVAPNGCHPNSGPLDVAPAPPIRAGRGRDQVPQIDVYIKASLTPKYLKRVRWIAQTWAPEVQTPHTLTYVFDQLPPTPDRLRLLRGQWGRVGENDKTQAATKSSTQTEGTTTGGDTMQFGPKANKNKTMSVEEERTPSSQRIAEAFREQYILPSNNRRQASNKITEEEKKKKRKVMNDGLGSGGGSSSSSTVVADTTNELRRHLHETVVLEHLSGQFGAYMDRKVVGEPRKDDALEKGYQCQRDKTRWVLARPLFGKTQLNNTAANPAASRPHNAFGGGGDGGERGNKWRCYLDDDVVINMTNLVLDLAAKTPLCEPNCFIGMMNRNKDSTLEWTSAGWCMEAALIRRVQQVYLPLSDAEAGISGMRRPQTGGRMATEDMGRWGDDVALSTVLRNLLGVAATYSSRWALDQRRSSSSVSAGPGPGPGPAQGPKTKRRNGMVGDRDPYRSSSSHPSRAGGGSWFHPSRRHMYAMYHQVDVASGNCSEFHCPYQDIEGLLHVESMPDYSDVTDSEPKCPTDDDFHVRSQRNRTKQLLAQIKMD